MELSDTQMHLLAGTLNSALQTLTRAQHGQSPNKEQLEVAADLYQTMHHLGLHIDDEQDVLRYLESGNQYEQSFLDEQPNEHDLDSGTVDIEIEIPEWDDEEPVDVDEDFERLVESLQSMSPEQDEQE